MFQNEKILELFLKFFWVGLIFGVVSILFKFVVNLFRRNTYVLNTMTFIFWLGFGSVFNFMCIKLYNYSFCWFGLLGIVLGLVFVKISIGFFFDYFVSFIYNKVVSLKNKRRMNGKLQTNKKIWKHC